MKNAFWKQKDASTHLILVLRQHALSLQSEIGAGTTAYQLILSYKKHFTTDIKPRVHCYTVHISNITVQRECRWGEL